MTVRSVTINDVARRAKVSNATVSRYLNNTSQVNRQKAEDIEAAIKELGFRLNRSARILKTERSMQIMMIVPDIDNPFYSVAYKVVQEIAMKQGYIVMLFNTNSVQQNELNAINLAHELNCDALIFCSTYDYPAVFKELADFSKPIVASNFFEFSKFDSVHSQNRGLYITTKYLLSLGHTKIAYAGGEESSIINKRRFEGYTKAMKEAGLTPLKEYIHFGTYNIEGGIKAAKHFMSLPEPPTAIASANDLLALGAIRTIISGGKRVPEDYSVCGMDNIEYSSLCVPDITTVTNDSGEFARLIMQLLLMRLNDGYDGPPKELLTSRELVVRSSTAKLL